MKLQLQHVSVPMPADGHEHARAFYGGVLGFDEVARPAGGRAGVWFAAGPVQVHLGVEEAFRAPARAHPGFRVRGLDALRARLVAAGQAPVPAPDLDGARRFHAADPFGNRLEFLAETT